MSVASGLLKGDIFGAQTKDKSTQTGEGSTIYGVRGKMNQFLFIKSWALRVRCLLQHSLINFQLRRGSERKGAEAWGWLGQVLVLFLFVRLQNDTCHICCYIIPDCKTLVILESKQVNTPMMCQTSNHINPILSPALGRFDKPHVKLIM